ncbi:MAG: DUF2092 domain-containing protein [Capsulimonadales bacterium]|nr:DUF2092 domain-containing protein [Capsulimonadales bacterium]
MTSRYSPATAVIGLLCLSSLALAQEPTEAPKQDAPKPDPATVAPPLPSGPPAPPEKKIDADAKKALDEMVKTYQDLKSLSGKMAFTVDRGTDKQSSSTVFTLARPNKVSIVATVPNPRDPKGAPVKRTIVSDGQQFFGFSSDQPKSYYKDKALPEPDNIARGMTFSGGAGSGLMPLLLTDPKAADKVLGPSVILVEFGPDEKVDNVDSRVINATLHENAPTGSNANDILLSFAVGKEDSLLRRVTVTAKMPQGSLTMTESYSELKVNGDLAANTFAFTPPAGAKAEGPGIAPPAPAPKKDGAKPAPGKKGNAKP